MSNLPPRRKKAVEFSEILEAIREMHEAERKRETERIRKITDSLLTDGTLDPAKLVFFIEERLSEIKESIRCRHEDYLD